MTFILHRVCAWKFKREFRVKLIRHRFVGNSQLLIANEKRRSSCFNIIHRTATTNFVKFLRVERSGIRKYRITQYEYRKTLKLKKNTKHVLFIK